ncbi:MAG: type II toxin-antitoxin system Phd/YefM family antitoxin [Puniceicoccaceae bacterium]
MKRIGIFRAKTHLSDLCREVKEQGSPYLIEKRGKPVAMLSPVPEAILQEQPDIVTALADWEKRHGPDKSRTEFPEVWKLRTGGKAAPELD